MADQADDAAERGDHGELYAVVRRLAFFTPKVIPARLLRRETSGRLAGVNISRSWCLESSLTWTRARMAHTLLEPNPRCPPAQCLGRRRRRRVRGRPPLLPLARLAPRRSRRGLSPRSWAACGANKRAARAHGATSLGPTSCKRTMARRCRTGCRRSLAASPIRRSNMSGPSRAPGEAVDSLRSGRRKERGKSAPIAAVSLSVTTPAKCSRDAWPQKSMARYKPSLRPRRLAASLAWAKAAWRIGPVRSSRGAGDARRRASSGSGRCFSTSYTAPYCRSSGAT